MKVQRENRGVTGAYSVVQGFFWMSFAAVMGFSSVYLLGCGLTSSQVGLILAVSGIGAFIIQPVLAGYADLAAFDAFYQLFGNRGDQPGDSA